ncbi:MAG: UvrD-helicase domain-containing protein [Planctomycetes bacterium]|nr:UvrD-helicase domain-containing protein [Planctomycetota bacterium]
MGILDDCTPAQVEAITHMDGPLLVVAGAGSGKTRVITRRVAYLIEQGVRPWDILAITFTNKAAGEMKERIAKLGGRRGVWVSTFHSMCARMLRQFSDAIGYEKDFTIYDAGDSANCIRECMKRLEINTEHWPPRSIQRAISNAKNDMIGPEEFANKAGSFFEQNAARVYMQYQAALEQNQALDFDDLLFHVAKLVSSETDFLEHWRARFNYVLIDEYQDTNHAQYLIARELAAKHRNICATGDPDQSIYGWRGADISNILEFVKEYPDAKVVKLEENFRSTKRILKAAEQVIVNNDERIDRALYTNSDEGTRVRLIAAGDEGGEAEAVVEQIDKLRAGGYSYGNVAIFYRTNAQSRSFEQVLALEGIPYVIVGTVEFYNRKEIKDILAYLRVLVNDRDNLSVQRIINTPPRGIGTQTQAGLQAWARENHLTLMDAIGRCKEIQGMPSRALKALGKFGKLMETLGALSGSVADIAKQTIEKSGYLDWVRASKDTAKEDRDRNLGELVTAAARYVERTPDGTLRGYLEEVALISQIDEYQDGDDRLSLMTVHAAKGLEFPVVFITGLEEGLFPLQSQNDPLGRLQEERRLCYVAITRAQKELFITCAAQRMRFGMTMPALPSRFIREIPEEVIEKLTAFGLPAFEPEPELSISPRYERAVAPDVVHGHEDVETFELGQHVQHPTFGRGEIIARSGSGSRSTVLVRFQGVGVKRLVLEHAKLQKV